MSDPARHGVVMALLVMISMGMAVSNYVLTCRIDRLDHSVRALADHAKGGER